MKEIAKTAIKKGIHEVYRDIFRGGMPKLVTTDIDRDRFYSDYVNTYLERDIKDLSQVASLSEPLVSRLQHNFMDVRKACFEKYKVYESY